MTLTQYKKSDSIQLDRVCGRDDPAYSGGCLHGGAGGSYSHRPKKVLILNGNDNNNSVSA